MSRQCPFHGCDAVIDPTLFACRKHWGSMNQHDRTKIVAAYNAYREDRIGPEELFAEQAKVMARYNPKPLADQGVNVERELYLLARDFLELVKSQVAYEKTPPGMIEAKKKAGGEAGRKRNALAERCKQIVSPKRENPTIPGLDNPPESRPAH